MAGVATLTPANELPVRMAFCHVNPWCRDDEAWQARLRELQQKLIKSPADEARFEARAAAMARDMESVLREIEGQIAAVPPSPTELPPGEQ